jgi:hypothetical protein
VSRRWWALVAVGLATFMTYLDRTHTLLLKFGVVVRVRRGETRDMDHVFLEPGDGLVDRGAEFARNV